MDLRKDYYVVSDGPGYTLVYNTRIKKLGYILTSKISVSEAKNVRYISNLSTCIRNIRILCKDFMSNAAAQAWYKDWLPSLKGHHGWYAAQKTVSMIPSFEKWTATEPIHALFKTIETNKDCPYIETLLNYREGCRLLILAGYLNQDLSFLNSVLVKKLINRFGKAVVSPERYDLIVREYGFTFIIHNMKDDILYEDIAKIPRYTYIPWLSRHIPRSISPDDARYMYMEYLQYKIREGLTREEAYRLRDNHWYIRWIQYERHKLEYIHKSKRQRFNNTGKKIYEKWDDQILEVNKMRVFSSSDFEVWDKQAKALYQCIIRLDYYKKVNSRLLFCTSLKGTPLATAEVELDSNTIVQAYANERNRKNCKPTQEQMDAFEVFIEKYMK